jgi:hypothetical protein
MLKLRHDLDQDEQTITVSSFWAPIAWVYGGWDSRFFGIEAKIVKTG